LQQLEQQLIGCEQKHQFCFPFLSQSMSIDFPHPLIMKVGRNRDCVPPTFSR
jgi:hypothetical protein